MSSNYTAGQLEATLLVYLDTEKHRGFELPQMLKAAAIKMFCDEDQAEDLLTREVRYQLGCLEKFGVLDLK